MSLSRNVPGDAPALARLMNAFNRWHQEDLPNEPITLSLLHAHLPGPLPVPAAVAFLNALPLLDLVDIPEDNRTCEICTAPYHSLAELSATNHSVEAAIRTPCGHLFGNHCLCRWLDPFEESKRNTCPYCRRAFFDKLPEEDTVEGMQARVDIFEWIEQNTKRKSSLTDKARIKRYTKLIVRSRLEAARVELRLDRSRITANLPPLHGNLSPVLRHLSVRETVLNIMEDQLESSRLRDEVMALRTQLCASQAILARFDQTIEILENRENDLTAVAALREAREELDASYRDIARLLDEAEAQNQEQLTQRDSSIEHAEARGD